MKITIIGCGVIGSALARHFAKRYSIVVCDRNPGKCEALAKEIDGVAESSAAKAIAGAEMVVLAIKPKDFREFAKANHTYFAQNQILVSVLAGTLLEELQKAFPQTLVVRALPNLPMICEKGVIGFSTHHPTVIPHIDETFKGLGLLRWLTENHLEALSALAGSGPGFIFLLIEAMIESGLKLGFSPEESKELVLKTLEGSVTLAQQSSLSPAELKRKVASPGGTTEAGLKVLEERGIREIIKETYLATFHRAQELHK